VQIRSCQAEPEQLLLSHEGRNVNRAVIPLTFCAGLVMWPVCAAQEGDRQPSVRREFRGVWVASVSNIDWPSRAGLPVDTQKKELLAILDKAVELNLNAVVLQVRPAADALYASRLEPWSPYLTGVMGKPPEPFYDPLKFAVEEAHRRGLQLHAWFNPYRVRMDGGRGEPSPDHSSQSRQKIVRQYGEMLWFDPGEPKAEDHFIAVLNDVVKRYDIDGVHIDDYFYPYQVTDKDGKVVPFPDDVSYRRAVRRGEKLGRDDWRRQNVNHLIERMYAEVKRAKPWVLMGISPFGIWRPENPPGIAGLDQYSTLYADARLWLQEGWLDYMTPQLYWRIDSEKQSYPKLLAWWAEQNVKQRHLWPGNFTSRVRRSPDDEETATVWAAEELVRQIEATRAQPGATGNIHFSMKALMRNNDGVATALKEGVYAEPALAPESAWLGGETPAKPRVSVERRGNEVSVEMEMPRPKHPWQWLVSVKTAGDSKTSIVPGSKSQHVMSLVDGETAKAVTVCGVSRLGRLGPPGRAEIPPRD
jgi:uncharacterized lipoprotein YddW (UPF0748 family)